MSEEFERECLSLLRGISEKLSAIQADGAVVRALADHFRRQDERRRQMDANLRDLERRPFDPMTP